MKKQNDRLAGCVRWPGITVAAKDLKVNRIHLYRILTGQRRDLHAYRARYATWRRTHGL